MSILRRGNARGAESADGGRRSFFWKLGAGVSTALASTAGIARAGSDEAESLAQRVATLEAEKALRDLHRAFEQAIDAGRYDEVVGMFAADAEVVFNGGVFRNRRDGVSRLYQDHFAPLKTGRRMQAAPGFELDAEQQQESVEVSPDRRTAKARFPYSIQVGAPIETETSLASMARLHGEGVRTWWEGGVYEIRYVKDFAAGRWTIDRLEYQTLSRADYRVGRSYASAMAGSPMGGTRS